MYVYFRDGRVQLVEILPKELLTTKDIVKDISNAFKSLYYLTDKGDNYWSDSEKSVFAFAGKKLAKYGTQESVKVFYGKDES